MNQIEIIFLLGLIAAISGVLMLIFARPSGHFISRRTGAFILVAGLIAAIYSALEIEAQYQRDQYQIELIESYGKN